MSEIKAFSVKELLSQDQYIIPVYQRNYAWGAKEIEQLIQDVQDYSNQNKGENYYIGTLVVSTDDKNTLYYTIDGQQRLTTLSILLATLRNEYKLPELNWFAKLNLSFESRPKSTRALSEVFHQKFSEDENENETNIQVAYQICHREIERRTHEPVFDLFQFVEYVCDRVIILRVPLPPETDLNHYFEIMNSRGEQLEKHEILKALLLKTFAGLKDEKKLSHCFNLIWEGAANMERYIQYGFSVDQRHLLFGNQWNTIAVNSFDEIVDKIGGIEEKSDNLNRLTIEQIVASPDININTIDEDEAPSRFNTVVDFPNFLLHVLRVQIGTDDVALDDKRLILLFEKQMRITNNGGVKFVKTFIFNLLTFKFLFDKYIIKREFRGSTSSWSLQCLKWYTSGKSKTSVQFVNTFGSDSTGPADSDNRRILMLLSMFHVSIPSMSYKYWLNAALNYLSKHFEVDSQDYIAYLEHIAKSFVFDRFLSANTLEYFPMINENLQPIKRDRSALDLGKLRFKEIENNLLFNFVDYLLWNKHKSTERDPRVAKFEYTFRSSREHYYPQTPVKNDLPPLEPEYLHSFGNLCLISHEKNSRLNNFSPSAKKDFFSRKDTIDSLKQFLMMRYKTWSKLEMKQHEGEMIDLLVNNMDSAYGNKNGHSIGEKWFNEYQTRNRNLLIRALFCFGDIAFNRIGNTYDVYDLSFIRKHDAFTKFLQYVNDHQPASLFEVIDRHLDDDSLKFRYQYLFIKYAEVLDYCKNGLFQWKEAGEPTIYLLEYDRNSKKQAKEIYTWLLQLHLEYAFDLKLYSDNEGLYININYVDGNYELTQDKQSDFQLQIWNADGREIHHQLISSINGNHAAVKLLPEYKWEKAGSNIFERFGKATLLTMGENWYQGFLDLIEESMKLLKNGFKIKPLQQ